MELFYELNSWAGRSEWLDQTLRFFYACAVPLLATLLAAVLNFAPRHPGAAARRRVGLAALIAMVLAVLTEFAVNYFAKNYLDADILSPRPFVTHRVNLLVIEPNDNSFPCIEVMMATSLATLLWAASPRWGLLGWIVATAFGFVRIACGSNYFADSAAGWALGAAAGGLSLALCRAHLHLGLPGGRRLAWRPAFQGAFAVVAIIGFAGAALYGFAQSPRFSTKIRTLFNLPADSKLARNTNPQDRLSTTLTSHEGEGMTAQMPAPSSPADTSFDQHRSDFLPEAEKLLRATFAPLGLPHKILSLDVAQVRAGTTAYRTVTIRLVVNGRGPVERTSMLNSATRLVRAAFWVDPQVQNVDIVAVIEKPEPEDFAPRPVQTPGPLPVFTASVARKDLAGGRTLPKNLADANPGAKEPAAAWLRGRSLLFFNERVLPEPPIAPVIAQPEVTTSQN